MDNKWILSGVDMNLQFYFLRRYMEYYVDALHRWIIYDNLGKQQGVIYTNNDEPMIFEEWVIGYLSN